MKVRRLLDEKTIVKRKMKKDERKMKNDGLDVGKLEGSNDGLDVRKLEGNNVGCKLA